MPWEEIEYNECSEDWRNRDRLIWATLPVAVTVSGVIIGVAYGYIPDSELMIRLLVLLMGGAFAIVMLISLVKHRYYQEGSEEQIKRLQFRLHIKGWNEKPRIHRPDKFGLKFLNTLSTQSGFKWMIWTSLLVLIILIILILDTAVQLIRN